ncbi:MAG: glycoside hydrolase family 99-like domain-containing protein, partial [Armatimonadetes bacterium]|nr:glycoside hydrolase family 99-like domain-containing protein [Armatimonadota bacterium]
QRDVEGVITVDYPSSVLGQEQIWRGKKKIGELPDVIDVMMGWDPRPWHGPTTQSYISPASPAAWEAALRRAKALLEETPAARLDRRLIIFDNWNEFGEGHYLEPCSGFGFAYLDAIKRVFCDPSPPCHDIVPEDLELPTPERVYAERRAILGGFPQRPRTVKDHLIAHWSFEEDDASLARDSSSCGFAGFKQDFVSAPGKAGRGFECRGGSVTVAPHSLFTPPDGLTAELWCRTDVAEQSDRWMLNNIGMSDSGWRLGFDAGKLCFQVPRTEWSHSLKAPDPLSLGAWHHVAATYDNEVMRLYVDGREVAHLERGGPVTPSGAALCIGSYATGHTRAFFQGVLDEVRIWDRALTAEEIAALAAE